MRLRALVAVLLATGHAEAQAPPQQLEPQGRVFSEPAPTPGRPNPTELAAAEFVRRAKRDITRGRLSRAARHYHDALGLTPTHVPALLGLAELRLKQGDSAEAAKLLTKAAFHGHSAAAEEALADLAATQGELKVAARYLAAAIEKEPSQARLVKLGDWYIKTGGYVAALNIWRQLLHQRGGDPDAELQVLALQQLCGSLDPLLAGAETDNWVRRSLAKLAQRGPRDAAP